MPKLTIIIPAYNAEKFVKKCMLCLEQQTNKDFEVIIIDDGSSDNTFSLLKELKEESSLALTIVTQENGGQAVARNKALKMAQGDYIMFVDIDDTIEHNMVEEMLEKVDEEQADIVWCHLNKDEHGEKTEIPLEVDGVVDSKKDYILNNSGPCAKVIKKEIITKNQLYFLEHHIYEDIAIVPTYALYANKIVHIEKPYYNYFVNPTSTMHQQKYHKKLEDIFSSLDNLSCYFQHTAYQEELEFIYIKHLLHAASLRFFEFKEGKDSLIKIVSIMKEKYPHWNKNKYYRKKSLKFKIVCECFYHKQFWLLNLLLK